MKIVDFREPGEDSPSRPTLPGSPPGPVMGNAREDLWRTRLKGGGEPGLHGAVSLTTMAELNGAEIIIFDDASQWEAWLADHYELPTGVWLKIAKKGSGIASVTLTEALDVALCYGWIDSHRKSYDEAYFLQKYSRRRSKSRWSRVNVDKTEVLVAAGRMREPGLAEILAAQADGRWEAAYESQKNATVPPDLAAALERNEQAKVFFETLDRTNQYAVFFRLMTARTPDNRAVRLQEMIAQLEAGKKFSPQAPARSSRAAG